MQMPIQTPPPKRLRPANNGPRVRREQQAITAMLHIFCRDHHQPDPGGLCPDCTALLDLARQRLENCKLGESKQACADCTTNCYGKVMRPQIVEVTAYARPRLFRHRPLLALWQWWDHR